MSNGSNGQGNYRCGQESDTEAVRLGRYSTSTVAGRRQHKTQGVENMASEWIMMPCARYSAARVV
jgi:hypothetical protein